MIIQNSWFILMHINAAVIGLGVGESHLISLQSHPYCQVKAICDINETVLQKIGSKYPSCTLSTDPNLILNDPNIQLVSIASYDDVHEQQVLSALRNNKHVFVEKPLCLIRMNLVTSPKNWCCIRTFYFLRILFLRKTPLHRVA